MSHTGTHKPAMPPYVSFGSLVKLLDAMAEQGVPDVVDRSFWGELLSDTVGGQLMGAMRFLGLLDDFNSPTPEMLRLVPQEERSRVLGAVLIDRYSPVLNLIDLSDANRDDVDEAFSVVYGVDKTTLRKATTFFIHAGQSAELPMSTKLSFTSRPRRSTQVGTARPKVTPAPGGIRPTPLAEREHPANTMTVEFKSGGKVTVAYDVDLFRLSEADRSFLIELIDTVRRFDSRNCSTSRSPFDDDPEDDDDDFDVAPFDDKP